MLVAPREFLGTAAPAVRLLPNGQVVPTTRIYLDATATSLMPRCVHGVVRQYLEECCANSHTTANAWGRATTEAIDRARTLLRELMGAGPGHTLIFVGNGATGACNRLAKAVFRGGSARPLVVVTEMEHHSNILPWSREAGEPNLRFVRVGRDGSLDLAHLDEILAREGGRVRIVSVTAASNVTGAVNPIRDIAERAHRVGAEIAVDAAQGAPHVPIRMHDPTRTAASIDHLILSGHKLYAPGSPGVLIADERLFPSDCVVGDVGGGTVEYVGLDGVSWTPRACDREEGGTPNIPGTIALGAAAKFLLGLGMERVAKHEQELAAYAVDALHRTPEVVVYGPPGSGDRPRAGVVAFNLARVPHYTTAACLSDRFAIAVRNECFCAQPYVRKHLYETCDLTGEHGPCTIGGPKARGMVRASFGLFTSREDIDALVRSLAWIRDNAKTVEAEYAVDGGHARHRTFRAPCFDLDRAYERARRGP